MKFQSHVNEWKNKEVFKSQLKLNEKELDNYPIHWSEFLYAFNLIKPSPKTLLDIGCGVGVYYELCRRHHPEIEYCGVDYSKEAIQLAKNKWKGGSWSTKLFSLNL
mgnify:CR=1 FL=1